MLDQVLRFNETIAAKMMLVLAVLLPLCTLIRVPTADAKSSCADVALVLAVDGSGSVTAEEFAFLQAAIAAALRSPRLNAIMRQAGRVDMAVVFWGDQSRPIQKSNWFVIESQQEAEMMADFVDGMPREVLGNTGLGAGIAAALDLLGLESCAHRAIVNVSGDGPETIYARSHQKIIHPEDARARAEAGGITINGLVISSDMRDLADYYRRKVITGPGAFVMEVETYSDFATALERKLIREISPPVLSQIE